jgi:hypothetical protein
MSARDSASGSSDWHGGGGSFGNGGGGAQNGGIGGGMGGGGWGGGAGYNGGYQSRQGMSTGTTMYGNTAFGSPGEMARAFATRARDGSLSNFRAPNGAALGVPQAAPHPAAHVPGLLSPTPSYPAVQQELALPSYPPAAYDPLTSVAPPQAPALTQAQIPQFFSQQTPQSYFMADRVQMPNMYDYAVQAPSYMGSWPGQYSPRGYNDPSLGTGYMDARGLGNYSNYNQGTAAGGKSNIGGGGSMGTWR